MCHTNTLISKPTQPSKKVWYFPSQNWTLEHIKNISSHIFLRASVTCCEKKSTCGDHPTIYVAAAFCPPLSLSLSRSFIKSKLGVEACSISCFIYGKKKIDVCTAGLVLWLFWSSFIRGCSIFISAVSPLFCSWIAPFSFCFRSCAHLLGQLVICFSGAWLKLDQMFVQGLIIWYWSLFCN